MHALQILFELIYVIFESIYADTNERVSAFSIKEIHR